MPVWIQHTTMWILRSTYCDSKQVIIDDDAVTGVDSCDKNVDDDPLQLLKRELNRYKKMTEENG